MGGNVLADEVTILECAIKMSPFPSPEADPGFYITHFSSSETPPPVDVSVGVSCTTALAGLLDSGYKLREVAVAGAGQVYILISNKKRHD